MARSARIRRIARSIAAWTSVSICGWAGDLAYCSSLASLPEAPQASTTQKVRNPLNDLLDEAQAAIDKNEFAAAIAPLQKFIAEKPDVAFAHFQLAYVYTNLKRPAEAQPEYERAIVLDPKFFESYLNLGILLLEKSPKDAVAPLQKAVELQPAQNHPHYLLAVALDRSGDEAGAAEQFQQVLALEPNDVTALKYLGWYYLRHGKPAEAETKFREALQVASKDQKALLGLAQSLEAEKKPEAAEAYQEYLSNNPGDIQVRDRLVRALIDQKQYDAALAELNKTPDPSHPSEETLRLRADILLSQKQSDAAIDSLKLAVGQNPQDAKLHGDLGRLYLGKRDFANAEKELKIALALDKGNLTFLKNLASTYYLAGDYPLALAGLEAIEKVETLNAGQWFIRALCYDKLVQILPALDAYRKFLALDQNQNPDQVWQANQRIHVLQKMADKKR